MPPACLKFSRPMGLMLCAMVGVSFSACSRPTHPNEADLYVRTVDGNVFDTAPVYGEAKLLRLRRTGFEYKCSECHKDFEHELTSNRPQGEHREVLDRFDHGGTIYCLSCHHQTDRNSFVDNLGQPMSEEPSETLCARCHGPIFGDWKEGIHGRINGHWSEEYGPREKLTCLQCHDPHRPSFPQMKPSRPRLQSRLTAAIHESGETH